MVQTLQNISHRKHLGFALRIHSPFSLMKPLPKSWLNGYNLSVIGIFCLYTTCILGMIRWLNPGVRIHIPAMSSLGVPTTVLLRAQSQHVVSTNLNQMIPFQIRNTNTNSNSMKHNHPALPIRLIGSRQDNGHSGIYFVNILNIFAMQRIVSCWIDSKCL